ncbi:hypothetical protein BDK51DRAFT_52080 [Blyttiomyces helicus]|uniref:Uncharacterized protein n=1 Tax=Blyttiomyces helicus TaxID=388810 RepID=A0A4V1IQH8_9FUNG|nr:hypothetical protein BDK51DRAFT_52080 [Blyttiomyces helicus]|eukprot:RKO86607.1 hypothetical protein BDK51DRAFT_52080 [Blyttiomyces helicus]
METLTHASAKAWEMRTVRSGLAQLVVASSVIVELKVSFKFAAQNMIFSVVGIEEEHLQETSVSPSDPKVPQRVISKMDSLPPRPPPRSQLSERAFTDQQGSTSASWSRSISRTCLSSFLLGESTKRWDFVTSGEGEGTVGPSSSEPIVSLQGTAAGPPKTPRAANSLAPAPTVLTHSDSSPNRKPHLQLVPPRSASIPSPPLMESHPFPPTASLPLPTTGSTTSLPARRPSQNLPAADAARAPPNASSQAPMASRTPVGIPGLRLASPLRLQSPSAAPASKVGDGRASWSAGLNLASSNDGLGAACGKRVLRGARDHAHSKP